MEQKKKRYEPLQLRITQLEKNCVIFMSVGGDVDADVADNFGDDKNWELS